MSHPQPGVLFVCLGNICRSPAAEGSFRRHLEKLQHKDAFRVDSCGTAAFNAGKPPDPRMIAAASAMGMDISGQRARQIQDADFRDFNYIIAMDRSNLDQLKVWCPEPFEGELALLLDFQPGGGNRQIADPYYADADQFSHTLSTIDLACETLLTTLLNRRTRHAPNPSRAPG